MQLHAVELQLPKSTAACRLAVAAQATAAGLETGDVDMTGSEQLLEASYLEQTSQGQAVSAGAAGSDLNKVSWVKRVAAQLHWWWRQNAGEPG